MFAWKFCGNAKIGGGFLQQRIKGAAKISHRAGEMGFGFNPKGDFLYLYFITQK